MQYIDELKTEMEEFINSQEEILKGGGIPTASVGSYVRTGRLDLINIAKAKKDDVISRIKKEITKKIKPFEELDEIDRQIQNIDSEIYSYTNAAESYARQTTKYEIFQDYYNSHKRKRKKKKYNEEETKQTKERLPFHNEILKKANDESELIIKKIKRGFVLSIIIAVICTIFDVFMLYEPFSIGNVNNALLSCILFAIPLDALPAVVGILFSQKTSSQKKILLKQEFTSNVTSEKKDLKVWSFLLWFTIIITVIAFIIYFAARAVMIIGGDDFNIGWKLLQGWITHTSLVENPEEIEHNFASVSIITPFLSSVFALVASIIVSKSELNYVDQFCIKMKSAIKIYSEQCAVKINDLNNRKNGLMTNKNNKMAAMWTDYGFNPPISNNFTDFIMKVQAAARTRITETYPGTYEAFCRQARSCTEKAINNLKERLSSYSNNPSDVISMTITDEEQCGLDYIWNHNGKQHEQTTNHINELDKYIANIMNQWKIPENGIDANSNFNDTFDDFYSL